MQPAAGEPRRVQERHLRAWYVLADLYDRAGDPTAAGCSSSVFHGTRLRRRPSDSC